VQKVSKFKTATAYAKAWLDAAVNAGSEDTVFAETQALAQVLAENLSLWQQISAPINTLSSVTDTLTALAQKLKLSQISANALRVIAENARLALLMLILEEFKTQYYEHKGIIEVQTESAIALTEAQQTRLRQVLETKLGSPIVLACSVKPEVLGGLSIRYNSYLIDDTLKTKFEKVTQLILARDVKYENNINERSER
jgi:F-type H+-transporting ATPase subunit delta